MSDSETRTGGNLNFQTTHWSLVWTARSADSPGATEAWNKLCRAYWGSLFCYVRRRGHRFEEAQDLTQEFFARLLAKDYLQHLRHREGKFRSFLLTLLKHFLLDERDKARALKRGGGQAPVFLDALAEEERYRVEPADNSTPEDLFDRRWAQAVLEQALRRLREEYAAAGKTALFDALHPLHPGRDGSAASHAELGARMGLSESAVTSAIFRLRRRHSELLREEVALTVGRPEDVDEEIRYLIEIMGRPETAT